MLLSVPRSSSLGHYVRNSFAIHVGAILLIVMFSLVRDYFTQRQRRANILLVKSSVRVDVVAMPRMTLKELKNAGVDINMKESKKIVAEDVLPQTVPKKSESVEFQVKKKKVDFKNMLKQYSQKKRVEKVQKQVASKKKSSSSLKQVGKKRLKQLILEGNRLAAGSALTGSGGATVMSEFQKYASRFPDWVRPHWNLPGYLIGRNLQCRIRIFVSVTGELIKAEIMDSSGENEYDRKAIASIKSAAPFVPPPESVAAKAVKGNIVLGFPL